MAAMTRASRLVGASLMIGIMGAIGTAALAGATPAPRPPEALYAKTCGYCHGQHVAPIIRGRGIPAEVTKQYVRTGPRGMVAFRPTEISDAELDTLAQWLKTSKADPKEKGE